MSIQKPEVENQAKSQPPKKGGILYPILIGISSIILIYFFIQKFYAYLY